MFVYSSAEHHDKSNDKLSGSEFNIIFCQALSISVLYNQLHSLCTNSRLSPEPCSLLLFSNSTFNTEKVADHSKRPNKNLSGYSLKLATKLTVARTFRKGACLSRHSEISVFSVSSCSSGSSK